MINLNDETVTLRGKTEPILRFEVWWLSADGVHDKLAEAREAASRTGQAIKAVPVAVTETLYEII